MSEIRHYPELWYSVIVDIKSHHAEFKIIRITGQDSTGFMWSKENESGGNDHVEEITLADVFASGSVKWDGCSNWNIDELDRNMIHECDRSGLIRIGEILAVCWDLTKELLPTWHDV